MIACNGILVLLTHMQQGSLVAQEGNEVISMQPIGQVGSSGNTSEPHLHFHAIKERSPGMLEGNGVPILIDGRFLIRNATITR